MSNIHQHTKVPGAISDSLIDSLVTQVQNAQLPRQRKATVLQLYTIGNQLKQIADAYETDLRAGDAYLNELKPVEGDDGEPWAIAPGAIGPIRETEMWLSWLNAYEQAHNALRSIQRFLATVPNEDAA